MTKRRTLVSIALAVGLLLATMQHGMASKPTEFEQNRAKLLSEIISSQLTRYHYSHKPINDDLSKAAFDIYLKQLDPRKRIFLQKDVAHLKSHSTGLDDQLLSGSVEFPVLAEDLLQKRVGQLETMVKEIVTAGFDFDKEEMLETDSEKQEFCSSLEELRQRWRKILKYQVINRYLNLLDEEEGKAKLASESAAKGNGDDSPPEARKTPEELRAEAREKILKMNLNLFSRIQKRSAQDKYDRFFSVIARAFDPHSDFMAPTQKEDFDIHMRGSLEGIGAVLQEEDGYIKVVRIIPGGAASRQKGLHAEDVILTVAQGDGEPVDITDMRIREAVSLIRGKKGSEVRLTVKKPDGSVKVLSIIRDVVQLEETFVKSAVLPGSDGKKYGYVLIPSFYRDFRKSGHGGGKARNVTDDVRQSLTELMDKDIEGLVVDLRNNGGGALVDAVKTAGLFITKGPIVQVKTSDGKADVYYDYDPDIVYQGPMVVLVNRFSASASEILAGALQDYQRAVIVGSDHSFGKGTVQNLINLDNELTFLGFDMFNMNKYKPLGALKLTIQKFYRINGESTQHRGVVPDIVLPDRFKYVEAGEKSYENSLAWDKIDPISYTTWNRGADLAALSSGSLKRVSQDEDFQQIVEESEETKKRQEETLVAISLAKLTAEHEKLKLREQENGYGFGHGGGNAKAENAKEKEGHELTEEEEEKKLVDKLQDDPYVEESLFLLGEVAS